MKQYVTETFVLNPPKFELSQIDKYKNEIIYIEKDRNNYIPCLFIQDLEQCNKFLIIFHGNNEHMFGLEMVAGIIREYLNMNVIVVEYPGYSIYFSKRSPETILEDTTIIYDFIKDKFNVKDEDIFIYGRSIGSAPSIYLASQRNAKALFVVSGFSSLKDVGKGLYVGWALEDIFQNIKYISKVEIPTLFIHGKKDSLINYEQSEQLYNNCNSEIKDIKLIDNMDHNNCNLLEDIINNIKSFLNKKVIDIDRKCNYFNLYNKKFDDLFIIPDYINNYVFTLKDYSKYEKYFDESIIFMILLQNERVALVYNKSIDICDTINFNKYFSVESYSHIIFADSLKNGNLLYYTNDGIVHIIKIELTSYSQVSIFKIDSRLNKCKIIELDNENLIANINAFYPLLLINNYQNGEECKVESIKTFNGLSFNDIITLSDNQIAISCCQNDLLYIYNYVVSKYYQYQILFLLDSNNLFLINNKYLVVLSKKEIHYFDIQNISQNKFNSSKIYIDNAIRYCFFEGEVLIPTIIKQINNLFCLIGDNKGNITKLEFENDFVEIKKNNELIVIARSEIINFIQDPIKNIIFINFNKLLIQSDKNELFIFYKRI